MNEVGNNKEEYCMNPNCNQIIGNFNNYDNCCNEECFESIRYIIKKTNMGKKLCKNPYCRKEISSIYALYCNKECRSVAQKLIMQNRLVSRLKISCLGNNCINFHKELDYGKIYCGELSCFEDIMNVINYQRKIRENSIRRCKIVYCKAAIDNLGKNTSFCSKKCINFNESMKDFPINKSILKYCKCCDSDFISKKPNQVHCSHKCMKRNQYLRQNKTETNTYQKMRKFKIEKIKGQNGCSFENCGLTDPDILEFDHKNREDKNFNMKCASSISKAEEEYKLGSFVCTYHHRIKTQSEINKLFPNKMANKSEFRKKTLQNRLNYVLNWKLKQKSCVICNLEINKDNHFCFDCDHIDRGTKHKVISQISALSKIKVDAELAKCQLLCANCHKKKTYDENRSIVSPTKENINNNTEKNWDWEKITNESYCTEEFINSHQNWKFHYSIISKNANKELFLRNLHWPWKMSIISMFDWVDDEFIVNNAGLKFDFKIIKSKNGISEDTVSNHKLWL